MKLDGDTIFNIGILMFLGFYLVFRGQFVKYVTAKRKREAEEKERQAFSDALEEPKSEE